MVRSGHWGVFVGLRATCASTVLFLSTLSLSPSLNADLGEIETPRNGTEFVVEVSRGELYRSPQLQAWEFEDSINKYGIRSIISLRGENPNRKWYREQKAMSERMGVIQVDIPMTADEIPTRPNLLRLLDAFAQLPRPILVHCMAGVDRTGEAVAIYRMEYLGASREQALRSVFPSFMKAKWYFIRQLYQGELWAREQYDPCKNAHPHFDRKRCQVPNPDAAHIPSVPGT